MVRFATLLVASMALVGTAQAQSPTYRAVPAATVSEANVIADGVMWRCGTDGCVTSKATSRPAIVCQQAARQVGKLESFAFGTESFDAAALAKCNAKAKS
jgi:uridine phosphorylase